MTGESMGKVPAPLPALCPHHAGTYVYPQYFTLAEYRSAADGFSGRQNNRQKLDIHPLEQAPGRTPAFLA